MSCEFPAASYAECHGQSALRNTIRTARDRIVVRFVVATIPRFSAIYRVPPSSFRHSSPCSAAIRPFDSGLRVSTWNHTASQHMAQLHHEHRRREQFPARRVLAKLTTQQGVRLLVSIRGFYVDEPRRRGVSSSSIACLLWSRRLPLW
jgi:hypothetical protein